MWRCSRTEGEDVALSKNLLIDLGPEIELFLKVSFHPFMPAFDLREVLDSVVSAISVYGCAETELTEVAIGIAYGTLNGEFRIEAGDIPMGPHRDVFDAVMVMGTAIQKRLLEYGAYLPPDGYFPYHFEEVICDHLVRFSKADHEELGDSPTLPHFSGAGYRP